MNPSHSASVVGLDAGSSRCTALAALLVLVLLLLPLRKILTEGRGSLIHHPMLVRVSWAGATRAARHRTGAKV